MIHWKNSLASAVAVQFRKNDKENAISLFTIGFGHCGAFGNVIICELSMKNPSELRTHTFSHGYFAALMSSSFLRILHSKLPI